MHPTDTHLTRRNTLENASYTGVRIHKGINVSEPKSPIGSEIELWTSPIGNIGDTEQQPIPPTWSYIFIHNRKVKQFTEKAERDGIRHFVHKSIIYRRSKHTRGIKEIEKPTINGLIFLQGSPKALQEYLDAEFPAYHLVNNCSTHLPAIIPDSQMQPFMRILNTSPDHVRFLLHPFKYYAGGNTKLRITSGDLAGIEGYVIRIDRDRHLVMDIGGMAVAISGVHCEKFEVVE